VGTNRRQEQSPPTSNFTTIAAASLTAAECTEQSISGKTNENLQVLFIEGPYMGEPIFMDLELFMRNYIPSHSLTLRYQITRPSEKNVSPQ
jgi:hypothetical protein